MGINKKTDKNILIFVPSLGSGGAERVACRLASELSKRHQVYLIYYVRKEKTYFVGPGVHKINFYIPFRKQIPGKMERWYGIICKTLAVTWAQYKYKIDTSISFMDELNLVNVLSRGSCRKIISDRNDPAHKSEVSYKDSLFAHQHTDYAVFQTRRVQSIYGEIVRNKSCIIPNPTEVSCLVSSYREKKIVTVGRLHKQKNQKMLIAAFALFRKTHPSYHLHIYGDGELSNELHQAAEYYGVKDSVHFEGFKEDVHAAIADAEMFVLSSDYEGLPNALMEAMMMGHACISTSFAGAEELIEDERNGLLVPVGDKDALCKDMCRLSENPELRERLGKAAAVTAQAWTTECVVRLWERIL
jgi:glycosyltransferase involved in cell wall biosynthesis